MTDRPLPAAALAVVAPDGLLSAPKRIVALDVRCKCQEVLLRFLRTPVGLLGVWRRHLGPTWNHLQVKGDQWPGGERYDARLSVTPGNVTVADGLTSIGWQLEPLWFESPGLDEDWSWSQARCRCGHTLIWETLRPTVQTALAAGQSNLDAPATALLDQDAQSARTQAQHEAMGHDELARRQHARDDKGHAGP